MKLKAPDGNMLRMHRWMKQSMHWVGVPCDVQDHGVRRSPSSSIAPAAMQWKFHAITQRTPHAARLVCDITPPSPTFECDITKCLAEWKCADLLNTSNQENDPVGFWYIGSHLLMRMEALEKKKNLACDNQISLVQLYSQVFQFEFFLTSFQRTTWLLHLTCGTEFSLIFTCTTRRYTLSKRVAMIKGWGVSEICF
jgi:hypothetical protein